MFTHSFRFLMAAGLMLAACGGDLSHSNPYDSAAPLEKQAKGSLSGSVALAGESDHAQVTVELQNATRTYTAVSHNDGSFKITGVVPGSYALRFSARSFEPVETALVLNLGEALTVTPRTLAPKRAAVRGSARIEAVADGKAVLQGGVTVQLARVASARGNRSAPYRSYDEGIGAAPSYSAVSGSDGQYEVPGVPAGTYALTASNAQGLGLGLGDVVVTGEEEAVTAPDAVLRPLTGFFDIEAGGALNPAFTSSAAVTLRLAGFNAAQMAYAVTTAPACAVGAPTVYAALRDVTLRGEGENMVCVQFFSEAGEKTSVLTRRIYLDTTPPAAAYVRLDGGAAASTDVLGRVTLGVAAADAGSGLRTMKVANAAGTGCVSELAAAAAEPYVALKAWVLAAPAGEDVRHVCVSLGDATGNWSSPVSTSILWDPVGPSAGPVVIEGGAPFTRTPRVKVALAAAGATAMQLTDDGTFAGRPWEPYRAQTEWIFSGIQGSHTLTVRYRDDAGNLSGTAAATIALDSEAPTAPSLSINGAAAYTTAATVTLTLGAGDATGMQISSDGLFDSEPMQGLDSPVGFALPGTDGVKFVYARFYDDAGNFSETASAYIVLDRVAPLAGTPLINGGAAYTQSANVTLTLPVSGAQQAYISNAACQTGSAWTGYVPSVAHNLGAPEGARTVFVRYRDEAGNVSLCKQASITLDASFASPGFAASVTGPELVPGRTKSLAVWITFADASTDVAEVAIANDASFGGAAWQPVTAKKSWVLGAGDGLKTVYVRGRDAAGNLGELLMPSITLDQAGPESPAIAVTDLDGDTFAVSQAQVELRWTAPSDPRLAGYAVERYVPGASPSFVRVLDAGAGVNTFSDAITESTGLVHFYRVRAFDDLGNTSGWSSTTLAYPFAPLARAAWLINAEGLRYLFAPHRGTFSLRASRDFESLTGDLSEETLGVDLVAWANPQNAGEFGETLYVKTVNQDNTLAYESAIPTREPQRKVIAQNYAFTRLAVDSQGRPHVAGCQMPLAVRTLSDGLWNEETPFFENCWTFDMTLDSSDKTHILYATQTAPYAVYYMSNATGPWAQEAITTMTGATFISLAPSIVVDDTTGEVHAVLEVAGALTYARRATSGTWTFEPMFTGQEASIAVDSAGQVTVLYTDGSSVFVATRTGPGSWSSVALEAAAAGASSLKRDAQGRLHAVWSDGYTNEVHYGLGPTFSVEIVGSAGMSPSVGLDLDGRDRPYVVYLSTGSGAVSYAVRDGTWTNSLVGSTSGMWIDQTGIGVDALGNVHLAYASFAEASLTYYGRRIGRTDEIARSGVQRSTLAVDANDVPHLLVHSQLTGENPVYMTRRDGVWYSETVDPANTYIGDLALRADGTVHVTYYNYSTAQLEYAMRATAGTWTKQLLGPGWSSDVAAGDAHRLVVFQGPGDQLWYASAATTGELALQTLGCTGYAPSVEFDAAGVAHLAYAGLWGLEYRRFTGGTWSAPESIDPSGQLPTLQPLGDEVYVAYYQAGKVKYAIRKSGVWSTTLIDADAGMPMEAPSLAVSPAGWAAIVYEQPAFNRFNFATNASGGWAISRLGPGERYSELALGPNDSLHAVYTGSPADNYYGLHYLRDFFGLMPATSVKRVSAW